MSIYQKLTEIGTKYIKKDSLFKWGFNLSPMYRTSTARITHVSKDLLDVRAKLAISFINKNYVGSIFGGSMFSAVDPIPMVQLINILGNEFIVWDKSADIAFKAPAREDLYADFSYTKQEIAHIKKQVREKGEFEIVKRSTLTNKNGSQIFCEVNKTIYIASKEHFKKKSKDRRERTAQRVLEAA